MWQGVWGKGGGVLDLTGTGLRMGRPGASWWARWRITCAGGTGRGVVKHGGEDGGRPVVLHCVCCSWDGGEAATGGGGGMGAEVRASGG